MDFLGLKTLTLNKDTVKIVKEIKKHDILLDQILFRWMTKRRYESYSKRRNCWCIPI
jgi:DNA polymerase-3 subunit alpha